MNSKVLLNIVFLIILHIPISYGQKIRMNWPQLAGKSFDFIIFQGDNVITVKQDTIPSDGIFGLDIPKAYAPYIGIGRWLLTGTSEGGGLDMVILGHDFSVSCKEGIPSESNIVFEGYNAVNELNRLNREQQKILERHAFLLRGLKLYDTFHPFNALFLKELDRLKLLFEDFHKRLNENPNHTGQILQVFNMSKGIAPKLFETDVQTAIELADVFTHDLDINVLYTSGHWGAVISGWIQIHLQIIKDDLKLFNQFSALTSRIQDYSIYTELVAKVTYYLKLAGFDDKINVISPIVINSGKIIAFGGSLDVYVKARVGTQGPDLIFDDKGKEDGLTSSTKKILKSTEFAAGGYNQTLLVFYQSDCGHCEDIINQLIAKYQNFEKKRTRIISISSDDDIETFGNESKYFPWKDKFCDCVSTKRTNFKNYAVSGTPTLILLDNNGFILKSSAKIDDLGILD